MKNNEKNKVKKHFEKPVRTCPIGITLTNLTDEKLFNIKLFDVDFEKNDKIKYQHVLKDKSYKEFITAMMGDFEGTAIYQIQIMASCDYNKFAGRQLMAPFGIFTNSPYGSGGYKQNITPLINPYQMQSGTVMIPVEFLFFTGCQIEIPFLMPETSASYFLYPGTLKQQDDRRKK